ncbi:MAG: 5-dehydro-4-deoxy-D-glucuronate isomerase [Parafilimonas sp.]
MKIRFEHSPKEVKKMDTDELRAAFHIHNLMQDDTMMLVYTHYDRMITGGAKPVLKKLFLEADKELSADCFLERREIGIINVGGKGKITVDDTSYELNKFDCLYIGKGIKKVFFESINSKEPACFYFLSAQAHQTSPIQFLEKENVMLTKTGSSETSNERTIYKYIHADGIKSCQLVMGLTILATGSVWNTMPAHTHTRRTEIYFYFDINEAHRVFHLMGEPDETRHIVMANNEAVISPPWSIHSGCGTSNYSFIWGMAGENYTYTDMDAVEIKDLK